jgi:hypothetical protein
MRRREFIALLGGATAAWPLARSSLRCRSSVFSTPVLRRAMRGCRRHFSAGSAKPGTSMAATWRSHTAGPRAKTTGCVKALGITVPIPLLGRADEVIK